MLHDRLIQRLVLVGKFWDLGDGLVELELGLIEVLTGGNTGAGLALRGRLALEMALLEVGAGGGHVIALLIGLEYRLQVVLEARGHGPVR